MGPTREGLSEKLFDWMRFRKKVDQINDLRSYFKKLTISANYTQIEQNEGFDKNQNRK